MSRHAMSHRAASRKRSVLSRRALLGALPAAYAALSFRPLSPSAGASAGSGSGSAASGSAKGVSVTPFDGASRAVSDVGASWYYTWSSSTGDVAEPDGAEFVPMIWGADMVTERDLGSAKREGKQLLAFNEPDLPAQANMSVDDALSLWPRLQKTGLRMGAPAVASEADRKGGWLDRFLSGAADRHHTIDFIPVHWYGGDFGSGAADQLKEYLTAVHRRYGKPLWLTEYALIDFSGEEPRYPSEQEQIRFVRAAGKMLGDLSFVERHAWFTLSTKASKTGLYDDNERNATGTAYRETLNGR